jgi:type III restriction enzyme
LEVYLQHLNNFFNHFDWWFFSKIDETLDDVFIPYYNPKTNRIAKFKPDFIFWLKKGKNYLILFIDPKGTEHTDAFRKIDGYKRFFEINSTNEAQTRKINHNELSVSVKLFFIPSKEEHSNVPQAYSKYWANSINLIVENLSEEI